MPTKYTAALNPDRPKRLQMRTPWNIARYRQPGAPARYSRQQRRLGEQRARRGRSLS